MGPKKHRLLLGAHMSIAGGFDKAIERGESIDCTAIQIFTKSNRQWHAKPIEESDSKKFIEAWKKSSIQSIVVHATYLINIASADKNNYQKSIQALKMEIMRCDQLSIPYLILHPGAYSQSTAQEGISRIVDALDEVLGDKKTKCAILLENMAGQGTSLCSRFEQLALVYDKVSVKKRLGFAFDTCHAFAAGYDFSSEESYEKMWHEFDKIIGIKLLKAMHINDSKKECGSKVDRHEEIGKGKLGLEAFRLLFNDPRFFDIPKILETPQDDLEHYAHNMKVIEGLIRKKNYTS
jgi:deoxyribonuclease-4